MRPARNVTLAMAVAVIAVVLAPRAGLSQSPLPAPGARVRVSAPDLEIAELEGRLVRLTADSLTIDFPQRQSISVPLDKLSRFDVSTGKYRRAGAARGAKYGSLFGALAALGLYSSLYGCDEYCALFMPLYGAGGAVIGVAVGGLVGTAFPLDRWEPVSLPPRPNGRLPRGTVRQTHVGLTFRF